MPRGGAGTARALLGAGPPGTGHHELVRLAARRETRAAVRARKAMGGRGRLWKPTEGCGRLWNARPETRAGERARVRRRERGCRTGLGDLEPSEHVPVLVARVGRASDTHEWFPHLVSFREGVTLAHSWRWRHVRFVVVERDGALDGGSFRRVAVAAAVAC